MIKLHKLQTALVCRYSCRLFGSLTVTSPKQHVFHVQLNRPQKRNAIDSELWKNIKTCFTDLSSNPECRSIVLSGEGKLFCAGLDFNEFVNLRQAFCVDNSPQQNRDLLGNTIKTFQDSISSLEICRKPVIAAVHSGCMGAGVELIAAADIRYCSEDAWFQVKEIDIGMAADLGTLQRLPKIINQSVARELCYTGRIFRSSEAKSYGFVNEIFETKDAMISKAVELAEIIAGKNPDAIQAIKKNIVYSIDHTNQEGLDQIREMNQTLLQKEEFLESVARHLSAGR